MSAGIHGGVHRQECRSLCADRWWSYSARAADERVDVIRISRPRAHNAILCTVITVSEVSMSAFPVCSWPCKRGFYVERIAHDVPLSCSHTFICL
ncbi:hypothetical protein C8T65DRAFT_632341, partial [Cerioporus squamosus]